MSQRIRSTVALVATAAFAFSACSRDNGSLGPAPFPSSPNVFTDNFGATVNFAAFGGSKLDALSIDNAVKRSGSSSLKVTVPAVGDPSGSYAGGAFVAAIPRDLSGYNVLSFWARASIPAVLNVAGLGNDNTGTSLYTAERNNIALTTTWAKYTIAIPLAAKLIEEQGLFYFAEGPENGAGYEFWIDDIRFENLNTVVNVRPALAGGSVLEDIGGTRTITGTTVTVSVDGADQTVNAFPGYFTFTSSNTTVATVSAAGVISVLGGGTANITATLGATPATGTVALTAVAPPAIAAATPTRPAGDVISLFSDAYTNVPVNTWSADWDQADVADVTIAGNATKKYTNLTFAGIEFTTTRVNATAMTYLHADVFVGDASSFKIKLVDFGVNGAFGGGDDSEHELTFNTTTTPPLTAGAWSSLDIPLSAFTGLTGRSNLAQMIILGASRTAYLDNIYFYRLPAPPAPTAPTVAAPTPSVNAANVISMFSDAYTNVPVDTWRTGWSDATLTDTTIAGNAVKKYSALTFVGIETVGQQINAAAMTHFHLDLWTPDALTGAAAVKVKLVDFGPNGVFQNGDDVEHELTFTSTSTPALATGSWVSLDLPLSLFTGLTTRGNIAQLILVGDDPVNTLFVDNVYFYSNAAPAAPTVVITSGTAGTATGPVTFTFTFSTDVGTSFTAGDVVVTGGTAGALNQTNATTYTMVVTPTANTVGNITLNVAAGTFSSVGGTQNTAAASFTQPYNTQAGGGGNSVVSFDETTAPTLSPFEGVTAATVVADPTNASNMVARVTNGVGAQPWAGVTVSTGGQFSIPEMLVTDTDTRMTARVYSPAVGIRIRAKAENAVNGAQNHETNATTLTTVANAWETLTFDFAVASPTFDGGPTNPFNSADPYNKLSFFFDYGTKTNAAPVIFYLDDIRFLGSVGSALPFPPPVIAPTDLPPAPTLPAASVISLFNSSGTYTNIPVGDWNPNWGQGGSISDAVVATRTIKLMNLVNYQGVNVSPDGSATGAIDITGRNRLHISYWTADGSNLLVFPINAAGEYSISAGPITRNGWTDLVITINQPGFSLTSIRQLKFETTSPGRFFLDNIYFY
jgi:Bacterial Ig-like domain (group 2)